jgi:hypothetical protein
VEALYRQIEVALVSEELHDALDVIEAGVAARHEVLEQVLCADLTDGTAHSDVERWEEPAQIQYRKEVLGQLVYRALFIASWSSLEQLLSAFCSDLRTDLELRLAERDLSGRGVERSMKYVRKVADLDLDLSEWGWPMIRRYGRLRNHLVHVGPNAEDGNDAVKARSQFAELPHVRIEANGEIVLESDFVREAIRAIQHLLIGVGKAVQQTQGTRRELGADGAGSFR